MENLVSLQRFESFYKGKKVFITGHTGFKGAWLMACLHQIGAITKGYALEPTYENGLFSILEPLKMGESVIADIRDRQRLKEETLSFQPDFIFHLAAQPLVRRSYEIPAETFDINVTGTANILEAVISLQKKCNVIVITTDKVYENKEQNIMYKETDTLGGYDPYSASKACAEMVVSSFRNSFFNNKNYPGHQHAIASVRAGNVIGGGDWNKDRLVPDIVKSLMLPEVIKVRNPKAVRPWQHVLEPVAGYLLLGNLLHDNPGKYSEAYNFGPLPDDHLSVQEFVDKAIASWGVGAWKEISDLNQPHEAGLLKLDVSKAMDHLNWKPKLNASLAIEWTLNWYKKTLDKQAAYTLDQIKEYFSL
jgi:CDP-glucose 4,6-dehydratase